jgi:hypothetical protein
MKTNEQRPELQAVHRMNEIATTREGKEALQRAVAKQAGAKVDLSPAQAALVNEYNALEQQHNSAGQACL